jgi:signal transduction histidine kinase
LQNAAKHVPEAAVVVRLAHDSDHLWWTVTDDGAGFDPLCLDGGTGLVGMRDRLAALGGSLEITSSSAGTVVRGRLPLGPDPS